MFHTSMENGPVEHGLGWNMEHGPVEHGHGAIPDGAAPVCCCWSPLPEANPTTSAAAADEVPPSALPCCTVQLLLLLGAVAPEGPGICLHLPAAAPLCRLADLSAALPDRVLLLMNVSDRLMNECCLQCGQVRYQPCWLVSLDVHTLSADRSLAACVKGVRSRAPLPDLAVPTTDCTSWWKHQAGRAGLCSTLGLGVLRRVEVPAPSQQCTIYQPSQQYSMYEATPDMLRGLACLRLPG
jgi:hypothetical protein